MIRFSSFKSGQAHRIRESDDGWQDLEGGSNRVLFFNEHKFSVTRYVLSQDLLCNAVYVVDNGVLGSSTCKKEELMASSPAACIHTRTQSVRQNAKNFLSGGYV